MLNGGTSSLGQKYGDAFSVCPVEPKRETGTCRAELNQALDIWRAASTRREPLLVDSAGSSSLLIWANTPITFL